MSDTAAERKEEGQQQTENKEGEQAAADKQQEPENKEEGQPEADKAEKKGGKGKGGGEGKKRERRQSEPAPLTAAATRGKRERKQAQPIYQPEQKEAAEFTIKKMRMMCLASQ